MIKRFFTLTLLSACAFLSACVPTISNRGNLIEADKLAEIKTGVSTREEVSSKLGTPTQVGTFDENAWYYFGRQTEQYAFLDPEIVEQKAIEIRFDDNGVVKEINNLDPTVARNDIEPVNRTTPTYGHEMTFFEQLVGNIGHPGSPIKNQH